MSNWWMLTGPYPFKHRFKRLLKLFVEINDVHHWAYCIETGNTGYKHVHLKLECSNGISLSDLARFFYPFHVEASNENVEYLRKVGNVFVSSTDTPEVRKVRFGEPNRWQKALLKRVSKQDTRQITVLVDQDGGLGKSWLAIWLYENCLAFFVPPVLGSPQQILQFICSGLNEQRIIVVDIPRSWKWTEQLITAMETVKDGLIFDARFASKWRNIRGCKVIIFANSHPDVNLLSRDRWDILRIPTVAEMTEAGSRIRNTSAPLREVS